LVRIDVRLGLVLDAGASPAVSSQVETNLGSAVSFFLDAFEILVGWEGEINRPTDVEKLN